MHRTTVMLPRQLKDQAVRLARQEGVSLGDLIRRSLESELRRRRNGKPGRRFQFVEFADKDGAPDVSARLDDYLYGEIWQSVSPAGLSRASGRSASMIACRSC